MSREMMRTLTRSLAAGICALAVVISIPAFGEAQRETAITCTNPVSGATWQIRIDYERKTVDSYPATISDTKISWADAKESSNYTLDRKSGDLTVVVRSSTAGHFLYDRCKLEN
jgi:hypothetical protein